MDGYEELPQRLWPRWGHQVNAKQFVPLPILSSKRSLSSLFSILPSPGETNPNLAYTITVQVGAVSKSFPIISEKR